MSLRYKGAVISATPPTTTGGNSGTAPGSWTLQQQMQAQAAGNWPNQPIWYIEDVFSTYLYTGNGSTQTITNGIDLSTYGGWVWVKNRFNNGTDNWTQNTVQGVTKGLITNSTTPYNSVAAGTGITAFNANGFSLGLDYADSNGSGQKYVSWTFRKQPKFFDVVTYTGNGTTNNVSHSLASTPGFILIKKTSGTGDWFAICRKNDTQGVGLYLNSTASNYYDGNWPFGIPPADSTTLKVSWINDQIVGGCNDSGATYVAYLFAHNAGGFGLTGTDNVISCGSFTTDSSGGVAEQTLGYEPQFIIWKRTAGAAEDWRLIDNMRGMPVGNTYNASAVLYPNQSGAEANSDYFTASATGFSLPSGSLATSTKYIYIAIRRGPMKTPTTGTSVFSPAYGSYTTGTVVTTGFPVDLQMGSVTGGSSLNALTSDRLRGVSTKSTPSSRFLITSSTAAEDTSYSTTQFWNNTGFQTASAFDSPPSVFWNFRRAPGFFDEVCYAGNGTTTARPHNLGVAPELAIIKVRDSSNYWQIWCAYASPQQNSYRMLLSLTSGWSDSGGSLWGASPSGTVNGFTASTFQVGTDNVVNSAAYNYVAYLFASCPGVSKVGSYTGTGTTQTISCGFTGGARFVLIKRTDSSGSWWVWDTARGMVAGTDPRLALNSTAAETNADWVYTTTGGFQIVTSDATVNASGGSYIYLAIA